MIAVAIDDLPVTQWLLQVSDAGSYMDSTFWVELFTPIKLGVPGTYVHLHSFGSLVEHDHFNFVMNGAPRSIDKYSQHLSGFIDRKQQRVRLALFAGEVIATADQCPHHCDCDDQSPDDPGRSSWLGLIR